MNHGNDVMKLLLKIMICVLPLVSLADEGGVSPAKLLEDYPLADRVWLGSFGGEVEVDPKSDLAALRNGEMQWLFADGAEVKEGDVVGLSAAGKIRQSADKLALEESSLTVKLRNLRWAHDEKSAGLERQMREIEARVGKLSLTPKERRLLGDGLARRLTEERLKLEADLAAMRQRLDPAFRSEELRVEQEQLRIEVERIRAEHEELVQSMEIRAPHDGFLRILKTGMVRANDPVGYVQLRGRASVAVQLFDPDIRSEPPETIVITVHSPAGEMFSGVFSGIDRPSVLRSGPMIYHFTLSSNGTSSPGEDLSGERMVTIYKLLGRKARIIPKTQFLFSHPEDIRRLGWAGFFRGIWPDARIIHIGPRSVALVGTE